MMWQDFEQDYAELPAFPPALAPTWRALLRRYRVAAALALAAWTPIALVAWWVLR